jgi:hypothetical protein
MSFEPNNIDPVIAAARAKRLLDRIAARDAFVASLAARIHEFNNAREQKSVSGPADAETKSLAEGSVASPSPSKSTRPADRVAHMAAVGRSGIRQNARRRRVGALHD